MDNLKDIKPLVEIPDSSFIIFSITLGLIAVFVLITLFFVWRYFYKKRLPNRKKEYLKILQNMNLSNTKESAYLITKYGRALANEPKKREILDELIKLLEEYKYKKDVDGEFKKEIKEYFDTFMELVKHD